MAQTENKNQHTLYRFVSLRNPELSKKENQTKRFVFHPNELPSIFFRRMASIGTDETKWQNLLETCSIFSTSAIQSVEKLEELVSKTFCELAIYLSINRTNFEPKFVLKKIEELSILDIKGYELPLWNNLFYQVVTQKNFYIKENIIHILVLINLIKEIEQLSTENEKIEFLPILANARVVLPTSLFELEPNLQEGSFAKNDEEAKQSIEEIQETNRQKATENSSALEKASKEITKLIQKNNKESRIAYQSAQITYEKLVAPIKTKFQQDIAIAKSNLSKEELANIDPNDKSNPINAKPVFPAFEFDSTQKLDENSLKENLSSESFDILKNSDLLTDNETYFDLLQKTNEAFNNEQRIIVENTNFSIPVIIIGGHAVYPSNKKQTLSKNENTKLIPAFAPEKFGVRNIGIADYKKVVSHVCCYKAGEVSHIENIMAKELRSKTTTAEHIEEFTQTTEKQSEKENVTDNTTTQRFEMQSEISKLLAEDKQFGAYSKYSSESFGKFEIGANYATNTSKEQSNRQAVTQAKDITNRAMERIVTKVRTETIRKTTDRFTEQNIHDYDNRKGDNHVSGVYRFINSIYQNQIYNYGKRMMYEFMIPEPSMLHRSGMSITDGIIKTPKMPIDPATLKIVKYTDINAGNYIKLCTDYQAEIVPFLEPKTIALQTIQSQIGDNCRFDREWNYDIQIPQGYKLNSLSGTMSFLRHGDLDNDPGASVSVSGHSNIAAEPQIDFGNTPSININIGFSTEIVDSINLYTWTWDIGRITYSLNAGLVINSQTYQDWQLQTFNAIMAGYQKQLDAYNQLLESAGTITVKNIETNPGFYRQIEQLVLRKECIAYIMDETKMGQGFYGFKDPNNEAPNNKNLANFYIDQSQDMDNYASFVKFMEQAFEWEIMSYSFYPFYWGARADWTQLYQYECNDPLFRSFMQAGMARVVVTVKPGFENAVLHYMTTGQIWNGGEVPVLGNPLYLSIVDEIREQEYVVEETWETIVPTSLIGIQESGVSIVGKGLPCDEDCKDHKDETIKDSTQKLMSVISSTETPIK